MPGMPVSGRAQRMIDRRSGRPRIIQSADVFVDTAGLVYVTDNNAGLAIIEYGG